MQWIAPIKTQLQQEQDTEYWLYTATSATYNSWAGYAFESVCYKHVSVIRKALEISPAALGGSWRYHATKNSNNEGAQIDLLFNRPDDAVTICEIKYTSNPYSIDQNYYNNLLTKLKVYQRETRQNKQGFFAIITASGLKKSIYSEKLSVAVVTLDDLIS